MCLKTEIRCGLISAYFLWDVGYGGLLLDWVATMWYVCILFLFGLIKLNAYHNFISVCCRQSIAKNACTQVELN